MAEPVTDGALPAPENFGQGGLDGSAGALVQRLERRLSTAAGVINTQTLHRHEAATTGLVGRLLQRLALPEQRLTRYQIGVAQPGTVIQLLQRFQRQEVMPAGGDRSWVQRLSIPGVEAMADSAPARSAIAASEPFSVPDFAPRALAEPTSVSGAERGAIAQKLSSSTVSDKTTTATPVGTFRIQRRTPSLTGAMLQPSAAVSSPLPSNTINAGDGGANSPSVGDSWKVFSPVVGSAHPTAATSSSSAEDLALAVPQAPAADPGGDLGQSSPVSGAQPTSVAQLKPIEPPMGDGSSAPLPLLRRYTLAEVMAPSPPRFSTALPLASVVSPTVQRSLDHESREPVAKPYALAAIAQISGPSVAEVSIQRHAHNPITSQNQASEFDSLPFAQDIPLVSKAFPQSGSPAAASAPPLPLALGAIAPNAIQRQTTETTVAEPSSGPPAPAPSGEAAPTMDAADMADQVSRILSRQLAVERERRGLGL